MLLSCNQSGVRTRTINSDLDEYDKLETLYHNCDTVIRKIDTVIIVNSKLDTTVTETGIFTYLQYDYPLTTPHKLINHCKSAIQFDKRGEKEKANELFKIVIAFYHNERPVQLKSYSDMNGYLQYEVNSAILCSYAYERLGDKKNAITTLQPFLANTEAWNSKIHERFIRLCIGKYGIDKVKAELNSCANTVKFKKQDAPENNDWVVNVFGADIGIGNTFETKQMTIVKADSIVRQMDFYKLAK